MPPENRQNTPGSTTFHDTLTELLARLAILSINDSQQEPPSGSIHETSVIKQFEPSSRLISDFAEEFGIPLPDVLWAFSLIFSPSRAGNCVVASVLRQQPQDQDSKKSLFTLYLTINKGIWSHHDKEYSRKWQNGINLVMNGTMPDSSDLLRSVTQHCKKRMQGYAESVERTVLGIIKNPKKPNPLLKKSCEETSADIAAWAKSNKPTDFHVDLNNLLEKIGKDWSSMNALTSLAEDCWKFLNNHGDEFKKLFAKLPKSSDVSIHNDSLGLKHPERARLFLKTIENFAKLPRAFSICLKFRNVLVSKKARFKIQLLDYSSITQVNRRRMPSITEVKSKVPDFTVTKVEEVEHAVMEKENQNPHCEIQLLQYFYGKDISGVWNVIGCSKRQCLACSALLRASDFLFEESHGKAYFQQLLSIEEWLENNEDTKSGITNLNQKLVKSKGYDVTKWTTHAEPDSPIGQDWSPSTLNNLYISGKRSLFHSENTHARTLPPEPSQLDVPIYGEPESPAGASTKSVCIQFRDSKARPDNSQAQLGAKKDVVPGRAAQATFEYALSLQERKEYIDAVKCIRGKPAQTSLSFAPGVRNRVDDFAASHVNQTLFIHFSIDTWSGSMKLSSVMNFRYKGAQPYWDWTVHS
ncbi:hypothetical protein CIB48_g10414, partial [Xylaria polymorpha]